MAFGEMMHSYFSSSILTLSITFSLYSFYGGWSGSYLSEDQQQRKARVQPSPAVSVHMWDIYNNGVNWSEVNVVKEIYPKTSGFSFSSRLYRTHCRRQLEFDIPKAQRDEVLVKAEVRITKNEMRNGEIYFQIYMKAKKWIFLNEKKVSDVDVDVPWVSLHVTPVKNIKPGVVTFLILTLFRGVKKSCHDFFHPVLLLSYLSKRDENNARRKRSLQLEDYEEETNKIWKDEVFSEGVSKMQRRVRSLCRKKSLYIQFSEIDYDSWIVAPSGYEVGFPFIGYSIWRWLGDVDFDLLIGRGKISHSASQVEAFQCVGKCTFPVSENLSPTKHAILQTLMHNMYPSKASRACCVPTRLDPISILYIDENGVLTYRFRYRDMVVAECGCR